MSPAPSIWGWNLPPPPAYTKPAPYTYTPTKIQILDTFPKQKTTLQHFTLSRQFHVTASTDNARLLSNPNLADDRRLNKLRSSGSAGEEALALECRPQALGNEHVHEGHIGGDFGLVLGAGDDAAHGGVPQRVLQRRGDERHAPRRAHGLDAAAAGAPGV